MEKLVINLPEAKSNIVKQILHGLGIATPGYAVPAKSDYKKRLLEISTWSAEELKLIEDAGKGFNNLKAEEW
jgi:hypothetical protein